MRVLQTLGVLLCLLAAGCPVGETGTTGSGDQRPATPRRTGEAKPVSESSPEYPAQAVEYLAGCLRTPAQDGYAALGPAWIALSRLSSLEHTSSAAALRDEVARNLDHAGDAPLPMLCGAWLATEPLAAGEFLAGRLAAGDYQYFDSYWYHPDSALSAFNEIDTTDMLERDALRLLMMVRRWQRPAEFTEQLKALAGHDAESIRLLAIGMLISCDQATAEQWDELYGAADDYQRFSNVAEAIKLSGDPEMAGALVPAAAQMEAGEPDPEQRQHKVSLVAYALTGLGGSQAELIRDRLLGARDPLVRWQARLGKLLHGQPDTWDKAVEDSGVTDPDLWLALQPEDIADSTLVPTIALAGRSDDARTRGLAALQLNRYGGDASNQRVRSLVENLITDEDFNIRSAAWFGAAAVGHDDLLETALADIADLQQPPEVRLGAAFYAMRLAEIQCTGGETE